MKLILVEWIDSHGGQGWEPLSELTGSLMLCRSVGWLSSEAKGHLVIVPHLSGVNAGFRLFGRGDITIPRKCVTKITVLRK